MTRLAPIIAVVMAVGGCAGGESATSTTTSTTTTTTVNAPDLDRLRQFAGTESRAAQIVGAEVVGGTLEISTSLFRDAESGPVGLGICIAAQEAGAEGHVRVLASDGGTIASTREDLSGNNAGKLCGIRVDQ